MSIFRPQIDKNIDKYLQFTSVVGESRQFQIPTLFLSLLERTTFLNCTPFGWKNTRIILGN